MAGQSRWRTFQGKSAYVRIAHAANSNPRNHPARRLDNLRYAIRDLASAAEAVVKQGHKVLYLNVGDPNIFDFATPPHVVEAACKAMRDNRNGYAPSSGIPEAVEALRAEAARKGITSVQDVFVTNGCGEAVDSV